jgi:Protein of unknown function (DUF3500)
MPCPDCTPVGRRDFLRTVAATAAAAAAGAVAPSSPLAAARAARRAAAKQAEDLVYELAATLTADQRKALVRPWDEKGAGGRPARLVMSNAPVGKSVIGTEYTPAQGELLDKLFRGLADGDAGYDRLSRGGDFDASGAFKNIGALVYGDPSPGKKFSLVFSGHHLTIRCDGNSEEGAAFGGPLYYGHTPDGYSDDNIFFYQTKAVRAVFDALDGKQRKAAVLDGTPGEQAASVAFRKPTDAMPGLGVRDMSADQRKLVEGVMRELISPYRKADGDEVMAVIRANGGWEKLSLAFYRDKKPTEAAPWHFWRVEGPGFVWNFRVLPHVHTFVSASTKVG